MVFFTLYQYVIDSYVNPFALDTLPVRLSQRCGDIPRSRLFPVPYGEKAPFRSAFPCGPEQVCFPDARPSGGLPPSSGIIKCRNISSLLKKISVFKKPKRQSPPFWDFPPRATSSSVRPVPCPAPSPQACAWRGGCTGGRGAGRCRHTRRGRTPDRIRCARHGNVRAERTPRIG